MELQAFARQYVSEMHKEAGLVGRSIGFLGGLAGRAGKAVAGAPSSIGKAMGGSWGKTVRSVRKGYMQALPKAERVQIMRARKAARRVARSKRHMMGAARQTAAKQKARLAKKVQDASDNVKPFWTTGKQMAATGALGLGGGIYLGSGNSSQPGYV